MADVSSKFKGASAVRWLTPTPRTILWMTDVTRETRASVGQANMQQGPLEHGNSISVELRTNWADCSFFEFRGPLLIGVGTPVLERPSEEILATDYIVYSVHMSSS